MINKNKPKISVILPTYNSAEFIKESILSILNQSIRDFELLIIDDCSTDNTFQILNLINDHRIIVYRNEQNLGLTKTLNVGLQLSRGEYIARMDADDISHKNRFFHQLRLMENNHNICVCGTSFQQFGAKNNKVIKDIGNNQLKGKILLRNPFAHPFVMFRSKFFKNNNIQYDESLSCAQDYALWIRLAHEYDDCYFENVSTILGYYRVHQNAISKKHINIQRKIASDARRSYLNTLCGTVSDYEVELHDALYEREYNIMCPEDVIDNKMWLLKLREANEDAGVYDRQFFNIGLIEKFRDICMSCLWLGGWVIKQLTSHPDFKLLNLQPDHLNMLSEIANKINSQNAQLINY